MRVEDGRVVTMFDPLLDVERASPESADLPFADSPGAASFALIERWTSLTITQMWVVGRKPTFVVRTATP